MINTMASRISINIIKSMAIIVHADTVSQWNSGAWTPVLPMYSSDRISRSLAAKLGQYKRRFGSQGPRLRQQANTLWFIRIQVIRYQLCACYTRRRERCLQREPVGPVSWRWLAYANQNRREKEGRKNKIKASAFRGVNKQGGGGGELGSLRCISTVSNVRTCRSLREKRKKKKKKKERSRKKKAVRDVIGKLCFADRVINIPMIPQGFCCVWRKCGKSCAHSGRQSC